MLDRQNVQDLLPLTPVQYGMLMRYLSAPEEGFYFQQLRVHLQGEISYESFVNVWKLLIANNEALRTVFAWNGLKSPISVVLRNIELDTEFIDATGFAEDALNECFQADIDKGLDIKSSIFRVKLFKLNAEEFLLLFSSHHLMIDGWSSSNIVTQFVKNYELVKSGQEDAARATPSLRMFYRNLKAVDTAKSNVFWAKEFQGYQGLVRLSDQLVKLKEDGDRTICIQRVLGAEFAERLKQASRELGVSASAYIYTVWAVLLKKYCNINDVVFGTTVSGRDTEIVRIEEMVGMFINTVPLRIQIGERDTVQSLIGKVWNRLSERREYERASIFEIKKECGLVGDVFESVVIIENYPVKLNSKNKHFEVGVFSAAEKDDIGLSVTLNIYETLDLQISFNEKHYEKAFVERLLESFIQLFRTMFESKVQPVAMIQLVHDRVDAADEQRKLVVNPYKDFETIDHRFEELVQASPNVPAIVHGDRVVSYAQMQKLVERADCALARRCVGKGDIVALSLERSLELVIVFFAIFKRGAVCFPISRRIPKDRVEEVANELSARLLVCEQGEQSRYQNVVALPELFAEQAQEQIPQRDKQHTGSDIAYLILTSGTTGSPKGVLLRHHNVMNLTDWFAGAHDIRYGSGVIMVSAYETGVCIMDMLGALLSGGTFHVLSSEQLLDKAYLVEYIKKHHIAMFNGYTEYVDSIFGGIERVECMKDLVVGGEKLKENTKNNLVQKGYRLFNEYGMTELTINSHSNHCRIGEPSAIIGHSITNVNAYVLDRDLLEVPIGAIGDLYVGGMSEMAGYTHGNTDEYFIERTCASGRTERLYRTGDLCSVLEDGRFFYVDRADKLVKIRGFRIDIAELEERICRIPSVRSAKVIHGQFAGDSKKYLIGYIVSDKEKSTSELRAYLGAWVPDYTIPAYFYRVAEIPCKSGTGKVDQQALLRIHEAAMREKVEEVKHSFTKTETFLVQIWKELLSVNDINAEDDFFELGGDSLTVVELFSRVNKAYPGRITVQNIFDHRTLNGMAECLDQALGAIDSGSQMVEVEF